MIYVRIEMWPLGRKHESRLLRELRIINDDTGGDISGNYDVELSPEGGFGVGAPERKGRVFFSRRNGVLVLLETAISSLRLRGGS